MHQDVRMRMLMLAVVVAAVTTSCSSQQPTEPDIEETVTSSVTVPPSESSSARGRSPSSLSGIVFLDGSVNGCGGEQIAVQVRESGAMVGSQLVDSSLEGFDCVYHFDIDVPALACYELLIESQPVGRYPASALDESGYVGVITSDNVYGDPQRPSSLPNLYADHNGC